ANVNKWDWWGRTPLYLAVDYNTLPHGGRPDHLSLDATTSTAMIDILLAAGANPNAQLKALPPHRRLPLHRGARATLDIPRAAPPRRGTSAARRCCAPRAARISLLSSASSRRARCSIFRSSRASRR